VLATQNPVDLDYKALSNSGTWFLGRLQTERDKARLLDGLQGITSGLSAEDLDRTLSALRKRVFLMHDVHEEGPVTFETRWTLSYLRGPLTPDELRRAAGARPEAAAPLAPDPPARPKPMLPAGIDEYFLPADAPRTYSPVLYGSARVHYLDARRSVDVTTEVHAVTPLTDGPVTADWGLATDVGVSPDDLAREPAGAAADFDPLPATALKPASYAGWARDMERWLTRERPLRLFSAPAVRLSSRPDETEAQFMARVHHAAREARDAQVEALRARYAARLARAEDQIRRAADRVSREEQQAQQHTLQTAVSFGATLLGALMGRKAASLSTLGRATTAARGAGRTAKELDDVGRARERVRETEEALQELEADLQREIDALPAAADAAVVETIEIRPKRGGVAVRLVALAWKGREGSAIG
jgi:hypothetical protein